MFPFFRVGADEVTGRVVFGCCKKQEVSGVEQRSTQSTTQPLTSEERKIMSSWSTQAVGERLSRRLPVPVLIATIALVIVSLAPARAEETVSAGAFTKFPALETDLKRGISKKIDVRRVLGPPKGSGHAVFPPLHQEREIWYYENMKVNIIQGKIDAKGVLQVPMRFEILQVYFDGDVLDGFMWVANTQAPTHK
jgi:hypothetical protein